MNKNQEALNYVLKCGACGDGIVCKDCLNNSECSFYLASIELKKLVDKATLKKVSKKGAYKTYDEDFEYEHYKCPNCNKEIVVSGNWVMHYDEVNYCKYCGQKLDWR